jgi:ATP-dependent DNA helicase RecG
MDRLSAWLASDERERLEFKEAKSNYSFDHLLQYCAALANEGGGFMVLGVTDKKPRRVVGTKAFSEPAKTVAQLTRELQLKIEYEEFPVPEGRVLVFHVPCHPLGTPVQAHAKYLMRAGDELRAMTPDALQRILDERVLDYSAEICEAASWRDFDLAAAEVFRNRWLQKSNNPNLAGMNLRQLLNDAELAHDSKPTYAGLILLGTAEALNRHLAQAEVVFEYRSSPASIAFQQRLEFRRGFLSYLDELWGLINLRNQVQHIQEGPFVREVPSFDERVVREAVLNAVTHRDYRMPQSIFIRQYPSKLEIVGPGGFPAGITAENILERQAPRNRRISEACAKCGLVERSGQGVDLMFRRLIEEAKPRPDFTGTDAYQVAVTLYGDVQNPRFLQFLERVGKEKNVAFFTEDLLVLDHIQANQPVPERLRPHLERLLDQSIVERFGRGRGVRFVLSRQLYSFMGAPGTYTHKRGLDRETNKALLQRHLTDNASGSPLKELMQVLPGHSRRQVQDLLFELKEEDRVRLAGSRRYSLWFSMNP